jgi:hypothetical protein
MSLFANVLTAYTRADRSLDRTMAAMLVLLAAAPAAALMQAVLQAAAAAPVLASAMR